ncbi:Chromosome partition protein Smc [Carpediemonas membranifera]|uniref:Chromosome partition protein Smc n=1 Tax=Carpediemonas membranifera TaxID=201153 RepID=A0A8J6B020_9EUKA|nr:Chromosome partition protein Smc [Carpediemonas membranifera]|eukprot:KAG9391339.1 Chromosome partition protein Smc [Carpediemonas membranifera]
MDRGDSTIHPSPLSPEKKATDATEKSLPLSVIEKICRAPERTVELTELRKLDIVTDEHRNLERQIERCVQDCEALKNQHEDIFRSGNRGSFLAHPSFKVPSEKELRNARNTVLDKATEIPTRKFAPAWANILQREYNASSTLPITDGPSLLTHVLNTLTDEYTRLMLLRQKSLLRWARFCEREEDKSTSLFSVKSSVWIPFRMAQTSLVDRQTSIARRIVRLNSMAHIRDVPVPARVAETCEFINTKHVGLDVNAYNTASTVTQPFVDVEDVAIALRSTVSADAQTVAIRDFIARLSWLGYSGRIQLPRMVANVMDKAGDDGLPLMIVDRGALDDELNELAGHFKMHFRINSRTRNGRTNEAEFCNEAGKIVQGIVRQFEVIHSSIVDGHANPAAQRNVKEPIYLEDFREDLEVPPASIPLASEYASEQAEGILMDKFVGATIGFLSIHESTSVAASLQNKHVSHARVAYGSQSGDILGPCDVPANKLHALYGLRAMKMKQLRDGLMWTLNALESVRKTISADISGAPFALTEHTLREQTKSDVTDALSLALADIINEDGDGLRISARCDMVAKAGVSGGEAATLRVFDNKRRSVLYTSATEKLKNIDETIKRTATTHIYHKEENLRLKDGENFLRVDRDAVLTKMYEAHLLFASAKRELVSALMDLYEHTIDSKANESIMQQIIDLIDSDLLDCPESFMHSYQTQVTSLMVTAALIREISASIIEKNTLYLQQISDRDADKPGVPNALLPLNAPPVAPHGGVAVGIADFHTPLEQLHEVIPILRSIVSDLVKAHWSATGPDTVLPRVAAMSVVAREALVLWRSFTEERTAQDRDPQTYTVESLYTALIDHPCTLELVARDAAQLLMAEPTGPAASTAPKVFNPVYSLPKVDAALDQPASIIAGQRAASVWDFKAPVPALIHTLTNALNIAVLRCRIANSFFETKEASAQYILQCAYIGQPRASTSLPQLNWEADTVLGGDEDLIHVPPEVLSQYVQDFRAQPNLLAIVEIAQEFAGVTTESLEGIKDMVLSRVNDLKAIARVQAATSILFTSSAKANQFAIDAIVEEEFRRERALIEAAPEKYRDETFLTTQFASDADGNISIDADDDTLMLAKMSIAARHDPSMRAWHFAMIQKAMITFIPAINAATSARSSIVEEYRENMKVPGLSASDNKHQRYRQHIRALKTRLVDTYADIISKFAVNVAYRAEIASVTTDLEYMIHDFGDSIPFERPAELTGVEATVTDVTDLFFNKTSLTSVWTIPTLTHVVRSPFTVPRPMGENTVQLSAVCLLTRVVHDIVAASLIKARFAGASAAGSDTIRSDLASALGSLQEKLAVDASSSFAQVMTFLIATRKLHFHQLRLLLNVTLNHLISSNAGPAAVSLTRIVMARLSDTGEMTQVPLPPVPTSHLYKSLHAVVSNALIGSSNLNGSVGQARHFNGFRVPRRWSDLRALSTFNTHPFPHIAEPIFSLPMKYVTATHAASINCELVLDDEFTRRGIFEGAQPVNALIVHLALLENFHRSQQLRHFFLADLMGLPAPTRAAELVDANAVFEHHILDNFLHELGEVVTAVCRAEKRTISQLKEEERLENLDDEGNAINVRILPEDTDMLFPSTPVPAFELFFRLVLHTRAAVSLALLRRQTATMTEIRAKMLFFLNSTLKGRKPEDVIRLPSPEEYIASEAGENEVAAVLGEVNYLTAHGLDERFIKNSHTLTQFVQELFSHFSRIDIAKGAPGYAISETQLARILNELAQTLFNDSHTQSMELDQFYHTILRHTLDRLAVEVSRRRRLEESVQASLQNVEMQADSLVAAKHYSILFRTNELEREAKRLESALNTAETDVRRRVTAELDGQMRKQAAEVILIKNNFNDFKNTINESILEDMQDLKQEMLERIARSTTMTGLAKARAQLIHDYDERVNELEVTIREQEAAISKLRTMHSLHRHGRQEASSKQIATLTDRVQALETEKWTLQSNSEMVESSLRRRMLELENTIAANDLELELSRKKSEQAARSSALSRTARRSAMAISRAKQDPVADPGEVVKLKETLKRQKEEIRTLQSSMIAAPAVDIDLRNANAEIKRLKKILVEERSVKQEAMAEIDDLRRQVYSYEERMNQIEQRHKLEATGRRSDMRQRMSALERENRSLKAEMINSLGGRSTVTGTRRTKSAAGGAPPASPRGL